VVKTKIIDQGLNFIVAPGASNDATAFDFGNLTNQASDSP
jgi:hypothetical protein